MALLAFAWALTLYHYSSSYSRQDKQGILIANIQDPDAADRSWQPRSESAPLFSGLPRQ